jgi:peptidoglycan/LPS O-acetylase OafA/YrhL
MQARARHFPLMDSMRAIAAITILLAHCSLWAGVYADGADATTREFVSRLEAAVAIFFLVSGFLLYRPFIAANLAGDKVDNRAYAWRRFLRIVPAYWVALTLIALLYGWHYIFTLDNFWRYYGFAQVYSVNTATGGISQAWTLCIEVTFYAFLPFWAIGMRALTRRAQTIRGKLKVELAAVGALILFGFLWQLWIVHADGSQVKTGRPSLISLPAFIDFLAIGMLLAVASLWWEHSERPPRLVRAIERFPSLCWAFSIGCFVLVSIGIGLTGKFFEPVTPVQFLARHELYGLIALGVITPAVIGDPKQGWLRRFVLSNPLLLWIGVVSYGFYLWHQAVIGRLMSYDLKGSIQWLHFDLPSHLHWLHPYLRWPLFALAGAMLFGGLSYYLFERPAMSLKRLVPARPGRRMREALAEPAPLVPEPVTASAAPGSGG